MLKNAIKNTQDSIIAELSPAIEEIVGGFTIESVNFNFKCNTCDILVEREDAQMVQVLVHGDGSIETQEVPF